MTIINIQFRNDMALAIAAIEAARTNKESYMAEGFEDSVRLAVGHPVLLVNIT